MKPIFYISLIFNEIKEKFMAQILEDSMATRPCSLAYCRSHNHLTEAVVPNHRSWDHFSQRLQMLGRSGKSVSINCVLRALLLHPPYKFLWRVAIPSKNPSRVFADNFVIAEVIHSAIGAGISACISIVISFQHPIGRTVRYSREVYFQLSRWVLGGYRLGPATCISKTSIRVDAAVVHTDVVHALLEGAILGTGAGISIGHVWDRRFPCCVPIACELNQFVKSRQLQPCVKKPIYPLDVKRSDHRRHWRTRAQLPVGTVCHRYKSGTECESEKLHFSVLLGGLTRTD